MRSLSELHPVLLPLLLQVLEHVDLNGSRDIDALEFMSGAAEITKASARNGLFSVGYDKSYSSTPINDINSQVGFKRAMDLTLRVRRHGALWCAPVCSTWVWIGRAGSGRSQESAYCNTDIPRIRASNTMVVRLVLLMLLAWSRGVHLYMENPSSTIIHYFSPLQEFIMSVLKFKVTVHLSSYGSVYPKPIAVWSTTPQVESLKRKKAMASEKLSTRNSDGSVTGRRKQLKGSQAYPPEFGKAVSAIYKRVAAEASMDGLLEEDAHAILAHALSAGGVQLKGCKRKHH